MGSNPTFGIILLWMPSVDNSRGRGCRLAGALGWGLVPTGDAGLLPYAVFQLATDRGRDGPVLPALARFNYRKEFGDATGKQ